jgi:hypothetical protein
MSPIVRAHCNSQWKDVYYEGLISRHVSLSIILLVVVSHYVSCDTIQIPFRIPSSTPAPAPVPTTIPDAPGGSRDPVSFIYDSFMHLEVVENVSVVAVVENVEKVPDDHVGLVQLCTIHAIALGSFLALWLPTTYTTFSAKSSAMWTIATMSICCCLASWSVCMLLYTAVELRKLSLCLSMHLAMQLLHSQGFLAAQDPSVSIYMPIWVARGIHVAQGFLLCYIAHSSDSIAQYDTGQFYMNHVWAVGIAEIVKQVVMAPVMLLVGMTLTTKSHND